MYTKQVGRRLPVTLCKTNSPSGPVARVSHVDLRSTRRGPTWQSDHLPADDQEMAITGHVTSFYPVSGVMAAEHYRT